MMLRYILIGIGIFAIIPIAWLGWWLGAPLITSNEVNEAFPRATQAAVPSSMSMAEVEALMVTASQIETEGRRAAAGNAVRGRPGGRAKR